MTQLNKPTLTRRLAVMHALIRELGDCGKIQAQKLSYFLQESEGVPLDYRFRMYHYGPYSDEVNNTLQLLRAMGFVEITPDPQGYGYHIRPTGSEAEPLSVEAQGYREKIRSIVDRLRALDSGSLELYATLHFVRKTLGESSVNDVIRVTSSLKPKFTHQFITSSYESLIGSRLIDQ